LWRARLIRGSVRECGYPTILAEQARFAHISVQRDNLAPGQSVGEAPAHLFIHSNARTVGSCWRVRGKSCRSRSLPYHRPRKAA
jgi:hypothetical protein